MAAEAAEGLSQGLTIGFSLLGVFAVGVAGIERAFRGERHDDVTTRERGHQR